MQTDNKLLDDFARVATGALGTLQGVRAEVEAIVKQRLERMLADMDMVPRDEFDAVKAMAATAREENERLAEELTVLKAEISALTATGARKATRSAAKGGAEKAHSDRTQADKAETDKSELRGKRAKKAPPA